jgi:hypothetical protein
MISERGTQKRDFGHRFVPAVAVIVSIGVALTGCHRRGAPQPPLLDLPLPVEDLASIRASDQVWLTWTMPRKTTHKHVIKGDIAARVCRREGTVGACEDVGEPLRLAPGVAGSFSENLPVALASGTPRALYYFVELKNRNDRSSGLSNGVATLAGAAPLPVRGLTAEMREDGVLLRWIPGASGDESGSTVIRLYRRRLTPVPATQTGSPLDPVEPDVPVETGGEPGRAVDKDIRLGETYEYCAQRVARVTVNGQMLELGGELSVPARINAVNTSPPLTEPSKQN